MNKLRAIKYIGKTASAPEAKLIAKWMSSVPRQFITARSQVPIRDVSSWEEEKQEIIERANWLCEKVIVDPKQLIAAMPQMLGPHYMGQWAIYSCSFLAFALYNISRLYPEHKEACIER